MISIDKTLCSNKNGLLEYFRLRADESIEDLKKTYGANQYKILANEINKKLSDSRKNLLDVICRKAKQEKWTNEELLRCVLMTTYTNYVVMIDSRNDIWPYEYMTLSRRIGELWEPFCKLCFDYSIKELEFFVPPLFSEVKRKLTLEIEDYIETLNISNEQKENLKEYYNKVWNLVTSGEIRLELDLHFEQNSIKYVVDFKSGFNSNEKGNTNRLLLVGSIYNLLDEDHKCLLLVRAKEDSNNHYFRTLKNSGIWEAHCGDETYMVIKNYTGFDLKDWINNNMDWEKDLKKETVHYFIKNNIDQYLIW